MVWTSHNWGEVLCDNLRDWSPGCLVHDLCDRNKLFCLKNTMGGSPRTWSIRAKSDDSKSVRILCWIVLCFLGVFVLESERVCDSILLCFLPHPSFDQINFFCFSVFVVKCTLYAVQSYIFWAIFDVSWSFLQRRLIISNAALTGTFSSKIQDVITSFLWSF